MAPSSPPSRAATTTTTTREATSLGQPESQQQKQSITPDQPTITAPRNKDIPGTASNPSNEEPHPANLVVEEEEDDEDLIVVTAAESANESAAPPPATSSYGSFFSGWWSSTSTSSSGSSSKEETIPEAIPPAIPQQQQPQQQQQQHLAAAQSPSNDNDDETTTTTALPGSVALAAETAISTTITETPTSNQSYLQEQDDDEEEVSAEGTKEPNNNNNTSFLTIHTVPSDEMEVGDDDDEKEGEENKEPEPPLVADRVEGADVTCSPDGNVALEAKDPVVVADPGAERPLLRIPMDEQEHRALDEAFASSDVTTTTAGAASTLSQALEPQQSQPQPSFHSAEDNNHLNKEGEDDSTITVPTSNVHGGGGGDGGGGDDMLESSPEDELDDEVEPSGMQTSDGAASKDVEIATATTTDVPPPPPPPPVDVLFPNNTTSTDMVGPNSTQPNDPPAMMNVRMNHGKIRGLGQVHPGTPVPNADACLRILRKFARKTKVHVPITYGGTKALGFYGYFFPSLANKKPDPTFVPYKILMEILYEDTTGASTTINEGKDFLPPYDAGAAALKQPNGRANQDDDLTVLDDESEATDRIVQGIMGVTGDTMDRARRAIAAFVFVFSSWGHASAHEYASTTSGGGDHIHHANTSSSKDAKSRQAFADLLAAVLNCASNLVAHGCLDHVLLWIGGSPEGGDNNNNSSISTAEVVPVTHLLTQSVLAADLHPERNELAAMKFVLTAGCRNVAPILPSPLLPSNISHPPPVAEDAHSSTTTEALLSGSHLLQTVRMLYHIFLTTESTANKIAARAALQQMVTHVFGRMMAADAAARRSSSSGSSSPATTPTTARTMMTSDGFPSEHHKNAFLILRAICKLSMRTLPDAAAGIQAHIGFQSSGSNDMWDGHQSSMDHPMSPSSSHSQFSARDGHHSSTSTAQLIYTSAIHPALESKILALDLIHHVLTHTDFPPGFVQRSGPQFHACLRNYLCVSLLKNCTSSDTTVVNWSLRIFVPTVRNFRAVLKNEIEAFVTNVFFVILDSKHSTADHKGIVVRTFDEICSDPVTLAEIFLNYDCDLSAVDLFHRIVQTLSRVSRTGLVSDTYAADGGTSKTAAAASLSLSSLVLGGSSSSAARMEKIRFETRELRLDAMKALRQVLASLHASIVEPMAKVEATTALPLPSQTAPDASTISSPSSSSSKDEPGERNLDPTAVPTPKCSTDAPESGDNDDTSTFETVRNPVEVYGSKKKRRAEEAEAILRFNQKPSAGLAFAAQCGHLQADDPTEVARYLWNFRNELDKTMIGEYLGREAEYQNGFCIRVLHEYVRLLDFVGLAFDEAIRYFLSGFRLPGEAQKIDRIMEKFAERFTEQNPGLFPTPDVAFILSFSIIMLNTDLHNPAIKEERRMTKEGFIRNNRGICDGQDLPHEFLVSIFDRIKENPISLKEDDEARERAGEVKNASGRSTLQAAMNPASFFSSHYDEMDRARESNFRKERDHIVRTTESLLKRRRHHHDAAPTGGGTPKSKSKSINRSGQKDHQRQQKFVRTEDSGLRDEYVAPMFEVAWGPALAAFSTAMESANGTMGSLLAIATDEELEIAAENAAETIEVCLTGFRFAICTGGLCGNDVARDSFMFALSRFTQLGSGTLLEPRHVRCCQTLLSLAREDGELLGTSWQHVFRALSEVNRFHQLFQLMARNDRAAAAAAERRRQRLDERESRRRALEQRKKEAQESPDLDEIGRAREQDWDLASTSGDLSDVDSLAESDLFSDDGDYELEEDMDAKAIDEANARLIYEGISEDVIEVIYERSSSLSTPAIKEFVSQLCYVSSMEISVGYGHKDLNHVSYRQQHVLLAGSSSYGGGHESQFHHTQPNIYNLQKLVEVAHYNMDSRPRLVFAELWSTIADHLTQTALHKNPALAMYAVDSFRQLSIQFLKRDELEAFEFQRRFLKPLETVMAQSKQSSTKELLLNCVARVIQVFDVPVDTTSSTAKGGLRSGWVPLLVILGLGARDEDFSIAKMSHDILMAQIQHCSKDLKQSPTSSVLLTEHFPETVDAVFMSVYGPHPELSTQAIQICSQLAAYLADQDAEFPHVKQRVMGVSSSGDPDGIPPPIIPEATQGLELWWPLLLGVSRATGEDERSEEFRIQALETLFGIINDFFDIAAAGRADRVQRRQLVFRGILTPMLEFSEVGSGFRPPRLPNDFERFLSAPRVTITTPEDKAKDSMAGWLDIIFDRFIDACIELCKRTIEEFQSSALVEEVFAILNHCLVSDSGSLAVRGVARLEQFVTSDLEPGLVTDDVWATVCHMLSRCLVVRGLPRKGNASGGSESEGGDSAKDYEMDVREFVVEENMLPDRRYVGSNAVMVIGNMLSSDRISDAMGFRWRLFLIGGLGKGIAAWEEAASLLSSQQRQRGNDFVAQPPPDYRENAYYGRIWMNRFLIGLASMEKVVMAGEDGGDDAKLYESAQKLVLVETQNLLVSFVKSELTLASSGNKQNVALHNRITKLAKELITGYSSMRPEHIHNMTWLSPILLSSCFQSKNEEVLSVVQRFVGMVDPRSAAMQEEEQPQPHVEDGATEEQPKESEQGDTSGEAALPVSAGEAKQIGSQIEITDQSGVEERQIDGVNQKEPEGHLPPLQGDTPWDETVPPPAASARASHPDISGKTLSADI